MASSPEATTSRSTSPHTGAPLRAVSALLVFGDSLSDVGNAFAQRGASAFPCPPHWRGRRCNGPVWVEHLAAGLGLPPLLHSLAGGSNHAFGGARSGGGLSAKGMPNLLQQVEGFLAGSGLAPAAPEHHGPPRLPRDGVALPAADPGGDAQSLAMAASPAGGLEPADTLVVLRAGANDYLDAPPGPSVAAAVNTHLLEAVSRLAAAGYRRFLVPSELPWGWAPLDLPGVQQEQRLALNALIAAQNQALRTALKEQVAEKGLLVGQPDAEALLLELRANPAAHGFAEVERPRLSGSGLEAAEVVPDAGGWLWWDSWGHLSSAFHRLLAERALESLRGGGLVG